MLKSDLQEPTLPPTVRTHQSARKHAILAAVTILFLAASFFVIEYDHYRGAEANLQGWYQVKVAGVLNEGDQYRIGMPYLAHFLELDTPLTMRQSIPLIEAISYGVGMTCLYLLLIRSARFQDGSKLQRTGYLGFFFGALQLPVLWIFPWDRPETLPTFCYLAVISLVMLETRIPLALSCTLAVLLSFVQALNRTDAPLVIGLSALVASVAVPLFRRRRATALLGTLCFATGGVTQLYLRHLFPDRHLGQRATTLQLLHNFEPGLGTAAYRLPAFLVALLPLFVTLLLMHRGRQRLDSTDSLTLVIALIYLPIYMAFGIISEVRIYVPYLFLLAPFIAKTWMDFATQDGAPSGNTLCC